MHKFWSTVFGATMGAAFLLTALAPAFGWWLPKNVATYGDRVDQLFYLILAVTGMVFILTEAILVYSLWAFGTQPRRKAHYVHGNHKLEVIWTLAPGVILVLLAVWQVSVWAEIKYPKQLAMRGEKKDALQIEVVARQWEWRIRYPDEARMKRWQEGDAAAKDYRAGFPEELGDVRVPNELHCWKGEPVLVHLKTADVIHSFFLPNFRVKQDALPGKTIPVWFQAMEHNTEPFEFDTRSGRPEPVRWAEIGSNPVTGTVSDLSMIWDLSCAEFCGARHSLMRGKLCVHADREDFLKWLRQAKARQMQHQPDTQAKPERHAAAN